MQNSWFCDCIPINVGYISEEVSLVLRTCNSVLVKRSTNLEASSRKGYREASVIAALASGACEGHWDV